MANDVKNLVKRIAHLVKEKNELLDLHEKLLKQNEELQQKNDRYKELLAKISPEKIREGELGIDRPEHLRFRMATVLFASISGFKNIKNGMNVSKMMDELDDIYRYFDVITKKYNIIKIKTIGDNFMCVGGIPKKNITNPIEVVMTALEMQHHLREISKQHGEHKIWELKLGIHTGPVTATVSGKKRINYDIKGDTVNIAHRMQSTSEDGEINISITTYELVKEFFNCEYLGNIPVKYKGDLEIFTVLGLKKELSRDEEGCLPNEFYKTKFGLIQFTDIQEIILDRLEKELPSNLYYHNVKHTVDVITQTELIGWGEAVSDEELLLLKTAALFHDAGHIIGYDNHEDHGSKLAGEYLPQFGYTKEQIERICELIMVTKLPPKPKDKLEQVMCDADLDYLGRSDMIPVSDTLFKELKERNKIGTANEWNKLQLKFISGHQYFTKTARTLREVNKQKQIQRIKKLITN